MNLKSQPIDGKFGTFGGKYVPETLMPVVDELEAVSYTHLTLPTNREV